MAAPIEFPQKLDLAQLPTPLVPLRRLSEQLGGPLIWVKRDDLTGSAESGNKIRKLEYVFAEAIKQGCDTVISCGGTQSNHCRATALLAARLGLTCHLLLREDSSPNELSGNLLLDHLAGAHIQTFTHSRYKQLATIVAELQADCVRRGSRAYFIPTGASDGVGLWGYIEAARELRNDCERLQIQADAIVCATGSGGTQGGLTLGAHLYGIDAEVLGFAVCDDAAYFERKVRADWHDWQQRSGQCVDLDAIEVRTNDAYIGSGYGIASKPVFDAIQWLAKTEGLVLDPTYTGKAFYGLISEIRAGYFNNAANVIFFHTGGVFGLMAQNRHYQSALTEVS